MVQSGSSAPVVERGQDGSQSTGPGERYVRPVPRSREGRLFKQYKPDQGKRTRVGTFIGVGAIIAWGTKFIYDRLQVYEGGEEVWRLLVTNGIPILFAVVFGAIAWRIVFGHRAAGDFLIATEGEMKKVSWSTRREIIGSTKVVIMFTILMALLLFLVDLFFQFLFSNIGVLKT